jgi:predicted nucleic acid-binding protein
MTTGKLKLYWDNTCWLAWLHGEGTDVWPARVVRGIQEAVAEVEGNKAILFTSTITRGEIFQGRLSEDQKEMYARLMRRRNLREVIPDSRIMDLASRIREHHANESEKRRIATPDATHLATAIIYQADEFWTMDGLQKDGSKNRKLLALNGNCGGHNLRIVSPYPISEPLAKKFCGAEGPLFGTEKK